ncbi:hypothetical protein LLE49_17550 [Alicyclobacillus tolerans]|uniref:hypothetical protein n=1 Tax=Alicyclobacillus tolerans TaxID=90970 RepID=UPI001F1E55D3|nr:hypothetical protein [Alicyclobacillus tolerans]MCF8566532.1 hypothetical protein [Alicyclobacillus tolerans]
MFKGIRLWLVWMAALCTGTLGMGLVYQGTIGGHPVKLVTGIPVLLLGIWVTGNILASAKQAYYKQRGVTR